MPEDNNIIDFIEFRMHRLINECAEAGEEGLATQMSGALDGYILGNMSIEFVDGWPLVASIAKNKDE
jgi:hypothetical protein